MDKTCAAFALLLLLFIPLVASANDNINISNHKDLDGSDSNLEYQMKLQQMNISGEENNVIKIEDDNKTEEKGFIEKQLDSTVKAAQTAFENALYGFSYGIIDQMMEGSVTIFDAEANVSKDKSGKEARSVSYTINTKIVKPLEPPFVKSTLLVTGIFYLCVIGFTILGSYLMLLFQETKPEWFSRFREEIFGEEKPYTTSAVHTACSIALAYPIIAMIIIFIITGTRNLLVFTVTPYGVVLPDMYVDSIPTYFLSGFSSWSSAIESSFGEYGIYTFCALVFVAGGITDSLLVIGALGKAIVLNVIFWGMYGLWNFIDIINVCAVSAGVYIYMYTGKTIMVTIGIVAGCLSVVILFAIIVVFAIWKGRKILLRS